MPYCNQQDKESVALSGPKTPGQLNYALTLILINYWKKSKKQYADANEIMGALSGASQEFYRRIVSKLEDNAIDRNGDIY